MEEVKKASVTTTLKLGELEAQVSLFKATGKGADAPEFEKAGPSGGVLLREEAEESQADAFLGRSSSGSSGRLKAATRPKVEEGTGEVIEAADERTGVRKADGEFVDLTDHLAHVDKQLALDRLEVMGFLARSGVPRERTVGSYWMGITTGAGGEAARPLALLYAALRNTKRVALVRWTKRKGQALGVLGPHGSGALLLQELIYDDEARIPNSNCLVIQHVGVAEEEVALAEDLIGEMASRPRELGDLRNPRLAAQQELAAHAAAGELDAYELPELEEEPEMDELADVLEGSAQAA